jgi:hypothetical protein
VKYMELLYTCQLMKNTPLQAQSPYSATTPAILQINENLSLWLMACKRGEIQESFSKETLDMQGSIKLFISDEESLMGNSKRKEFEIAVNNQSKSGWQTNLNNPVNVSYHWISQNGKVAVFDGERTSLAPQILKAGCSATQKIKVIAPDAPGKYRLIRLLVQEGVSWFDTDIFKASETELLID